MLSEEAKKEFLEVASSRTFQEDMRRMSENSLLKDPKSADLDQIMRFLTAASRFAPPPPRRRPPIYDKVFI